MMATVKFVFFVMFLIAGSSTTPRHEADYLVMFQKPIDNFFIMKDFRDLGTMCQFSSQCKSNCCLMEHRTNKRTCQMRALKGELCSNSQIKFDCYADFCPCESGNEFCTDYQCTE
ncbi:uncharacterized protein LOC106470734 isoform X1 [Limulus polyphemus]|uniref:Uncharacterized protein LOC106470734 isoform X1 n=1 Tax=Limulus polyphemus TaxID=6850 RepID=A0ABM1BQK7_LIMPO|nr:uncharacterized protein LOC106470734 isoform X1 [Limulus polyphemus]